MIHPVPHGLEISFPLPPDKLYDIFDKEMVSQACSNELDDENDDCDPGNDEPKLQS